MKEDNNIEKLFQGAFENFEVTPPVSVKTEIDKRLGKKKRRFLFWWLPALILVFSGAALAVVSYWSDASSEELPDKIVQTKSITPKDDQTVSEAATVKDPKQKEQSAASRQGNRTLSNDKYKSMTEPPIPESAVTFNPVTGKGKKRSDIQFKQESGKKRAGSTRFRKKLQDQSMVSVVGRKKKADKSGDQTGKTASGQFVDNEKKEKNNPVDLSSSTNPGKKAEVNSADKNKEPVNDAGNKNLQPKEKGDSLVKSNFADSTANQPDSVVKPTDSAKSKAREDDSKAKKWMIELYGGPRFGTKTSKTDFTLKDPGSYQIGLGFSRSVNLGPLKYVTLDGEYGSGKESYSRETTTTSVYYAGIDSIPVFDSITDSLIGYTYQENYDTANNTIINTSHAQITRFAFGLKAQFNIDFGGGFGLVISPGYYYSRSKYRFSDSTGTGSSSSSQILLGLGMYYDWNRFRFRIGLDSRYELMGKNQLAYIDRRKSLLFSPQIGVAFKF